MSEATQLIPDYTLEDFMSDKPYAYLYEQKENKFMLQLMVEKMRMKAKSVGFQGFMKMWDSYVKSHKSNMSVVGENDTMFQNQPVQLRCGAYICDENGVHRYSEMLGDVEVISHAIMPTKRVTNIETYEEKLELAYQRGKESWKNITVSREMLASSQKILALAKNGISVNSENAKEVIKYLSTMESLNFEDLPRQNSVSHMGWLPDGRFLPYVDDITYDGESAEFARMFSEFKPTGSADVWMDIAKSVRSGDSVPARIALAAGFAAPLLKIFNALPFFVHLWGATGCGKTVGLMLSASIWGNPDVGSYPKSFSGTKNFMEEYAAFCCNLPVYLDELQVINDNRKSFDDIIYMLCEGASKGRAARDGGLRLQKRWATCVITTGETPIIQSNSGGGAALRTIEVNYKGQPFFGTDKRAREVANLLKANYGHAGRMFVQNLQKDGVIDILRNLQSRFYSELSGDIDAKQIIPATILLAADRLADVALFKDGKSLKSDEIREFLITKAESDVNRRCYDFLLDWVDANPRRFDSKTDANGETWGVIEDDIVYINRTVFEDILRNRGFSPKPFLNWLRERNLIEYEDHGSGNERRMTVRKQLPGGRARCVAISMVERKKTVYSSDEPIQVDVDLPF